MIESVVVDVMFISAVVLIVAVILAVVFLEVIDVMVGRMDTVVFAGEDGVDAK